MAINAKIVLIFNQQRWGWTETYYWTSTSGSLNEAILAAQVLMDKRGGLLSRDVRMEAARVSDLATPGSALTSFYVNANVGVVNKGVSQEPWESFLIGIQASAGPGLPYSRKLMLRGAPQSYNTWTGSTAANPTIDPTFRARLTTLLELLTNANNNTGGSWCVRASNRNTTQNPRYTISNITIAATGDNFIIHAGVPPFVFAVGDLVHVSGARGPGTKGINADAYVKAFSAAQGTATLTSRQTCSTGDPDWSGKPVVYKRAYIFAPIIGYQLERWVKRDTGRPFFGTRGRRATSRC